MLLQAFIMLLKEICAAKHKILCSACSVAGILKYDEPTI
jgi:hypothetical protein